MLVFDSTTFGFGANIVDIDADGAVVEMIEFEADEVSLVGICINDATDFNFKVEVGFVDEEFIAGVVIGVISTVGDDDIGFIFPTEAEETAVIKTGLMSSVGDDDLAVRKAGLISNVGEVETAVSNTGFCFSFSPSAFWRENTTFVPRELFLYWAPDDDTADVSKTGLLLITVVSSLCFKITVPVFGLELLHLITFRIFRLGFIVSLSRG